MLPSRPRPPRLPHQGRSPALSPPRAVPCWPGLGCWLPEPRRQRPLNGADRGGAEDGQVVPVATLAALASAAPPQEFPVVATRQDAWNLSDGAHRPGVPRRTAPGPRRGPSSGLAPRGLPVQFHRTAASPAPVTPFPVRPRRQATGRLGEPATSTSWTYGSVPKAKSSSVTEVPYRHGREDCST